MKLVYILLLGSVLFLTSCQHLFYYGLPSEDAKKQFAPDKMSWQYTNGIITNIAVVGDDKRIYRLDVTPKTKLQATTIYGEVYTFYLQKIKVEDADAIVGQGKSWTGYELHDHVERTVYTRDIKTISVLSESQATQPID
jgi:hypothetical protein